MKVRFFPGGKGKGSENVWIGGFIKRIKQFPTGIWGFCFLCLTLCLGILVELGFLRFELYWGREFCIPVTWFLFSFISSTSIYIWDWYCIVKNPLHFSERSYRWLFFWPYISFFFFFFLVFLIIFSISYYNDYEWFGWEGVIEVKRYFFFEEQKEFARFYMANKPIEYREFLELRLDDLCSDPKIEGSREALVKKLKRDYAYWIYKKSREAGEAFMKDWIPRYLDWVQNELPRRRIEKAFGVMMKQLMEYLLTQFFCYYFGWYIRSWILETFFKKKRRR